MRKTHYWQFAALAAFIAGVLVLLAVAPVLAQAIPAGAPPPGSPAGRGTWQDQDGNRRIDGGVEVRDAAVPAATGGPDDYGYTWDDSVAFSWIDATKGTDTGMSGYSRNQRTAPIALPFAFKYYAGTYSAVYIGASGYVAFQDANSWPGQASVPSPAPPNSVVSPYSTPLDLAGSGRKNRVFYLSGGTAPNRYFVAAWNEVRRSGEDEQYTFEVVLHESGDIVFQYKTMLYNIGTGYYCGYAGIEDAEGLVGISYKSCDEVGSGTSVRFYRPQPTGRVSISPRGQGLFTKAGASESFLVTLRNYGELGADTYRPTLSSAWPAQVLHRDGAPLKDTDGDGALDTGPIAQGQHMDLLVRMQTPAVVSVGDNNSAVLTVVSTRTPGWQRATVLRSAVPAPFVQAYEDSAHPGARVNFADPLGSRINRLAQNAAAGGTAIAALPGGGHVVAWSEDDGEMLRIRYVVLDQAGAPTSAARSLLRPDGSAPAGYATEVAASVAPDGVIGLAWRQYESRQNNGSWEYRDNIYLATLDVTGTVILGPTDLTGNTEFGTYETQLHPSLYGVQIASAGASQFVVAWANTMTSGDGYTDNVHYTVRSANNIVIKPITQLSATDQLGKDHAQIPVLAPLASGSVILTYNDYWSDFPLSYVVLSSEGSVVRGPVPVGSGYGYPQAVAQMSNGALLLVWVDWNSTTTELFYAVVDSATDALQAGPIWLENPASATGDYGASIAADANGRAVVTWGERSSYYQFSRYYALLRQDGSLLTPPTAFLSAVVPGDGSEPRLTAADNGYAVAQNRAFDPSSTTLPDVAVATPPLSSGAPGGRAQVTIGLANHGLPIASSVVVTAQLAAELQYVSAVPEPVQMQAAGDTSMGQGGAELVWNVPSLSYLTYGQILLVTGVPSATIGSTYPVTITVAHAGADYDDGNMTVQTQVMVARELFTPLVTKGRE